MLGVNFGGPEAIIVLIIVLVLFGGSQIPKLARNLGRAQKEFKDGIEDGSRSASASDVTDTTATTTNTSTTPKSDSSTSSS